MKKVSFVIPTFRRKEKLLRLLGSISRQNFKMDEVEVIVVEDHGMDGTVEEILSREWNFSLKAIQNEEEKLVAECRNIGGIEASGEFIFFVDDDNVLEENCTRILVEAFSKLKDAGIISPIMLYYGTSRIWCAGVRRSMALGWSLYLMQGQEYSPERIPEFIEGMDFPNAFMVPRDIFREVMFDSRTFPFHYEETDLAYRIRNLGYKGYCCTRAIIWHDFKENIIGSPLRAYYMARNRTIFHRRYSKPFEFIFFLLFPNFLFLAYYLAKISMRKEGRGEIARGYFRGFLEGIREAFKGT